MIGTQSHPFVFRPGTNDEHVFRAVCVDNEYRLPDAFEPADIIVDIGMHIGSFCYAVLLRGSDNVYGFEPDSENYNCAVNNLRSFGQRVHLSPKAVWRSDVVEESMTIGRVDDNLGGWSIIWGLAEGVSCKEEVSVIAFDDVICNLTNNGQKRVKMLKIDCEGAEFPLLFTSRTLAFIDNICGEFHEIGGDYVEIPIPDRFRVSGIERFTIVELTNKLQNEGFLVTSVRHGNSNMGMFFATRKLHNAAFADRIKSILAQTFRTLLRSVYLL